MSVNPYPNLPHDKGNVPMQEYAIHASIKAVYARDDASNSSVITLSNNTTAIEITAIGASPVSAVMRWVSIADGTTAATSVISAAGSANFDHVIPNNTTVKFAVPIEGIAPHYASQGANLENGLYRRVAIKSTGVGSVLLSEF